MNKFLKYALLGTGAVIGISVAGVAYVAATFDPNDYKDRIVKAVKDSTQRTLRLEGDIRLAFFPSIGVSLGKVSLSEFRNDREFSSIESARVSLAVLPLLRKQVVVDEVTLNGLKTGLVMHKDGTTNIDDLLGKKEPVHGQQQKMPAGPAVLFDIASVSVKQANLSFSDEGNGAQYAIKNLSLDTGRILTGVPGKIVISATVQANKPKLDIEFQLKTLLTFDLDKQRYRLQDTQLQANGSALDVSNLQVKASGGASVDMGTREFTADKFVLNASGVRIKDKFEATLDAPSLNISKEQYSGTNLKLDAKMDGDYGNIVANLSLPGMKGNAQSFKVGALNLDIDVKQPEQTFKLKLSSPLSGSLEEQQFNLGNLSVAVNATGEQFPNKAVSSEMKGSVNVDGKKQSVEADLAGGLLQSKIKAKVGVKGFAEPAIKFDVDVDQLDADLYLPKKPSEAGATKSTQPEQELDLSALRKLNLDGSLRIGALKIYNVKSTQLRVDVKAINGLVNFNPLSSKLYQGSMKGSLGINAQGTPSITVIQDFNGVNVAPLMKDAANLDILEGRGNVGMNLTSQGKTVSAMKKALNGSVSVNLADGAIKGINLTKLVQGIQNLSKDTQAQTLGVDKSEKTEFSEFKASFKVHNGVAHNDDLSVKSIVLRLTGSGDIDIGRESMNYNAKAALAKTEQGRTATLPVNVSGTFDALKFKVDYGALLADVAKQKIDEQKEKIKEDTKTKLQEELKKGLKGLFR